MLKVTLVMLAVVLAGAASAGGWRSLRIDASSEAAFNESVVLFKDKLPPSRRHAFDRVLQDVWTQGTLKASAEQREFTKADYFARLDGLAYKDLVTLADPTGYKAKRYRAEYFYGRASSNRGGVPESPWPSTGGPPPVRNGEYRGATRSIDRQTH